MHHARFLPYTKNIPDTWNCWLSPEGPVFIHVLGIIEGGRAALFFKVFPGSSYEPRRHAHGHVLIVVRGQGTIHVDGTDHHYQAGDEFTILGNVLHGITDVSRETVVLEVEIPQGRLYA